MPLKKIKEIKGILKNHLICFLHDGQKDLGFIMLKFLGIRKTQTVQKLPIAKPISNRKIIVKVMQN